MSDKSVIELQAEILNLKEEVEEFRLEIRRWKERYKKKCRKIVELLMKLEEQTGEDYS